LDDVRACGAVCLSRAYRSFGKQIPSEQIWPQIAKQNRLGSMASTTHLMTLHAASQGLHALAIQARHPLRVLQICRDQNIRAILNHGPQPGINTGHFTMLVDVDDQNVVLFDPAYESPRRVPHSEFMQLWQPQSPQSEILGSVLIGIVAEEADAP